MIGQLAWAVLVGAAIAARPPAVETPLRAERYRSVTDAVRAAVSGGPTVVAFGEVHQTAATSGIPSALGRFTDEVLPAFANELSHLVVETWMTSGRCGEAERTVTADVQKTTERPAATETEIETLIRAAAAAGIAPRILTLTCDDYQSMRKSGKSGSEVDYDRTLRVTTRALETAVLGALRERWRTPDTEKGRGLVAVYGGTLHNDVHPNPELRSYSFAPAILAATLGRYVEIDLIVPEYAARLASIRSETWWKVYRRFRRPGSVVLVRRSARSFVILFPERSSTH
jgi:hypothetical protein